MKSVIRSKTRRISFLWVLVTAITFAVTLGQAAVVTLAEWQFDSYSGGSLANYHPEYGTQLSTAALDTTQPANSTFSAIVGTTLNATPTTGATSALQMKNGNSTVNYALTLHVSGTGLSGFVVSYAAEGENVNQSWAYRVGNSGAFTTFATKNAASTTSFGTLSVDFSSITALSGAADVYFQDTFTLSGNNKSMSFDNISITAVPEPVHYGLAAFGLIFVGVGTGRRLWLARKTV